MGLGLPSSSAGLRVEVENGWVNCVAAHRGLGIDGVDRRVHSLLANRRLVEERLILRVWVVGVVAFVFVQRATGRDFFLLTFDLLHLRSTRFGAPVSESCCAQDPCSR